MNILYFASLREQLGQDREHWEDLETTPTTGSLLIKLRQRGEPWTSALDNPQLIVSVNQEVADWNTAIKEGDEIAIFPPVTGG